MDRGTVGALALVALGVGLVLTTPPEPLHGVDVDGPGPAPADEPVHAFEDLPESQQETFRNALDGPVQSYGTPPPTPPEYVGYQGDTYRVVQWASETTIRTFFQTPAGLLLVVLGGGTVTGRRLLARRSS